MAFMPMLHICPLRLLVRLTHNLLVKSTAASPIWWNLPQCFLVGSSTFSFPKIPEIIQIPLNVRRLCILSCFPVDEVHGTPSSSSGPMCFSRSKENPLRFFLQRTFTLKPSTEHSRISAGSISEHIVVEKHHKLNISSGNLHDLFYNNC